MSELIGSADIEVHAGIGGYVVTAYGLKPDNSWGNQTFVCMSIPEVLARVKSTLEALDETDQTPIEKVLKDADKR